MAEHTRALAAASRPGQRLRERKKLATRRLLSETATDMFLAKGFESVRVIEIAEACGVSEKTVYNYFPTKESLLLDRVDGTSGALLAALADSTLSPVQAALTVLAGELDTMIAQLAAEPDFRQAVDRYNRFNALLESTAALRAYQYEVTERLTAEAARVLAERTGRHPEDPEPRIIAAALLALWPVQFRSLARLLDNATAADRLAEAVTADVRRAAAVLEQGLRVAE